MGEEAVEALMEAHAATPAATSLANRLLARLEWLREHAVHHLRAAWRSPTC